jgi:hypothetical protein
MKKNPFSIINTALISISFSLFQPAFTQTVNSIQYTFKVKILGGAITESSSPSTNGFNENIDSLAF